MFFGSNRNTGYHSCLRPRNGRSKLRAPLIPWLISMVLVSIYHSWMSTVSPLHLGYNTNLEITLPGIRAFDYRSACDGKAIFQTNMETDWWFFVEGLPKQKNIGWNISISPSSLSLGNLGRNSHWWFDASKGHCLRNGFWIWTFFSTLCACLISSNHQFR